MKKRNAKYLALFLALSIAVSPLSYTRAYAMDSEVETQGAAVEDAQSTPIMEETENTEETADSVGETGGEAETSAGEKSDVTEADITGVDAADSEKSDIVENEASVDKETDASDSKETGAVKKKNISFAKETERNTEIGKTSKKKADAQMSQDQEKEDVVPVQPTAPSVTGDSVKVVKEDGSEFKMFMVSESSVKKNEDKLKVTFSTTNISFDKLYLGSKDKFDEEKSIKGTNDDGVWTFTFETDAADAGKVQSVVLGKPDGTWYTKQDLWMYIPSKVEETPDPTPTPNPKPGNDTLM